MESQYRRISLTVIAILLLFSVGLLASDYKIGPSDVLEIKFWQSTDLNTVVKVSQKGTITLDVIGEISVIGKSSTDIQNEIVRKMSRVNSSISQAVVRITEFNYQYVFISGAIRIPGKLSFEEIPDLWTIINEAGNITEAGDLSRVTIIRGGKNAGKIEVVNISEALAKGDLSKLPKIGREDTIEIPKNPAGLPAGEISSQIDRKNLIYILGAVNSPGAVKFEENIDILEALAYAGGPVENADLSKVKIIKKDGIFAQTMLINLKKYSESGKPARYIVAKEDTFLIPYKSSGSFLGLNWGTIATVAGVVTSGVLAYDRLKD